MLSFNDFLITIFSFLLPLKSLASDFLQSMNMDQDPCEDFFEFACGGWIKSHPIADSQSSSTQFEMAINRLLDLLKGNRFKLD